MKIHLLRSAALYCLLIICTAWPFIQQSVAGPKKCGGIEGRVTSTEGWLIPGTTIRIVNRATNQSISVKTNASVKTKDIAEYSVCLATGTYDVFADVLGYKPMKRESIKVSEPAWVFVDFVMENDKSFRVDPEHP